MLLFRWDKPIGILLALWPVLWALWIAAEGVPPLKLLVIFILGTFIMRTVGCIINDIADRNFDPHVARTKHRPLATGAVSVIEAIILFIILSLLALGLVFLLNIKTILLAFIIMPLVIIYPFVKRFFLLPQLFLGLVFNMGILMAFTAVQDNWPPAIAWFIYAICILWTIAYDTMYALVDRDDDLVIGIGSSAIAFGQADIVFISIFQALVSFGFIILGIWLNLGVWYFSWLGAALLLIAYQLYLIKDRQPKQCFKAFLNNNWVGLLIFIGIF